MQWLWILVPVVVVLYLMGIRTVRPANRGLAERFGEYRRFAHAGFN